MNHIRKRYIGISMALALSLLSAAGCADTGVTPSPADASEQPDEQAEPASEGFTAREGDGVDVVYFETAEPCDCMAEVGEAVESSIHSDFAQELDSGALRFFMVVSDDPANEPMLEMFDAQPFDLFIVEYDDGRGAATPVYEIWNLMGDNAAIEAFVKAGVEAALAGQS